MGNYKKIDKDDILYIKNTIQDDERVLVGENINEEYSHDELSGTSSYPDVVVKAKSAEEIAAIMKYAYENTIPVTPRGAGTGLVGSSVPMEHGIMIDTTLMNQILELDEENLTVTVEPGVLLMELSAYVEDHDFFYPPDPGEKSATIGGNISTNAGGMRAVKYGVTRDYVMGLEVVLADGTVLTAGGKNRKDTTGLDLKEIVIGSEGTLAIITKCVLKLIPKPEKSISILVGYESLKAGIESVQKIIQANINPTAIEFIERKVVQLGEDFLHLQFPLTDAKAYLLLTFDGKESEITENIKTAEKVTRQAGAKAFLALEDPEVAANVWRIRGCLVKSVEAVSEQEPLDMVVPINQIDTFVNFINEYEKQCGMRMISFGHAGDGNVHLCVVRGDRDDATWAKELDANLTVLYRKCTELGGLASGEHGIGLSKQKYMLEAANPANIALMKRVKAAFDEKGILNPGISYDA